MLRYVYFEKRQKIAANDKIADMKNTTEYFRNEVLRKRPYLTIEMCRQVIDIAKKKFRIAEGFGSGER